MQANPSSGGNPAGEGNSPPSNSPGGRSFDSKSRDDSGSAAASALSSPEALRAIDARLSDCEHLSEQTAALTQQVAALTARDSARATQLTAVTSERDAALDAYNQLVPLYAQAFRAATHRRRRWFCLFVCSTGPRLNLPPPLRVSPPAPNAPNISPAVAPAIPDCQ